MKRQIKRLSPHQNGKVAAVIMAITSIIFILPFFGFMYLMMSAMPSEMGPYGNGYGNGFFMFSPMISFFIIPFFYLVVGYISTALFCVLYNVLVPMLGGFEFELDETDTAH
jgi:ABC-type dipeptide/oligopeptide/nickel transport system permease subunit